MTDKPEFPDVIYCSVLSDGIAIWFSSEDLAQLCGPYEKYTRAPLPTGDKATLDDDLSLAIDLIQSVKDCPGAVDALDAAEGHIQQVIDDLTDQSDDMRELVEGLNLARAFIKFNTKAENCVSIGDDIFSGNDVMKKIIELIAKHSQKAGE